MNKLQAIKYLKDNNINSDKLNFLKDNDIINISHENTQIDYQSENYDMIKELYQEKQEDGAYTGIIILK